MQYLMLCEFSSKVYTVDLFVSLAGAHAGGTAAVPERQR